MKPRRENLMLREIWSTDFGEAVLTYPSRLTLDDSREVSEWLRLVARHIELFAVLQAEAEAQSGEQPEAVEKHE